MQTRELPYERNKDNEVAKYIENVCNTRYEPLVRKVKEAAKEDQTGGVQHLYRFTILLLHEPTLIPPIGTLSRTQ